MERRSFVTGLCLFLGLFSFTACGGGGNNSPTPDLPGVSVAITPNTANLLVRTSMVFAATVSGHANTAVTYTVVEGSGGSILQTGEYLAPTAPGVYHVRATSMADPSRTADAVVTVRDYNKRMDLTTAPPDGFDYHTANLLNDGSVFIVGGKGLTGAMHKQAYRYIRAEDRYAADASLTTGRMAHVAFTLPDGKIVVAGGFDPLLPGTSFDPVFTSSEIYDPATKTFSAGPDMNFPRRHHVATQLKDSRILITGGIQLRGNGFGASMNTEIYDPATNSFTAGKMMTEGRWLHTATLLPDGRVLITGGRNNNCTGQCPIFSLKSAEIFDPVTGNFTATGNMNFSRYNHTASLLSDGRVLILGGESTEDLGTGIDQVGVAEIYDPVTGQFTTFGNMALARSSHTVTLLNNGKLLVAGGFRLNGVGTERTELFDPSNGTSIEGPAMSDYHIRGTATRLLNGEVLIFAGSNGNQPMQIAEIFR
jgi:hypothetical protein